MATRSITRFRGSQRWLSNFFPAAVSMDGIDFPTIEHGYQAAKTLDLEVRRHIAKMEHPNEAKIAGRKVELRADWEQVKESIMLSLLRQKFADSALRYLLLATGDAELIEGNDWGDRYWGVCNGEGLNRLGVLLMQVRSELRACS